MLSSKTQADMLAALKRLTKDIKPEDVTQYHADWKLALDAIAAAERELAPPATPPATLAIVIEGGMISAIVSDRPELFADVEVLVIDYDADGFEVPQSDGTKEDAHVEPWPVDCAKIDLAAVAAALDARSDAEDAP